MTSFLRFGGRFFRIEMRFENDSTMIILYVTLSVYSENSITNSACIAKISVFAQTS